MDRHQLGAQWESHDKSVAIRKGLELGRISQLHEGRTLRLREPIVFYPVHGGRRPCRLICPISTISSPHRMPMSSTAPPDLLPAGSLVRPIFDGNGGYRAQDGYVLAWVHNNYGLIPAAKYDGASLPPDLRSTSPRRRRCFGHDQYGERGRLFREAGGGEDRSRRAEGLASSVPSAGNGYYAAAVLIALWLVLMWSYWRAEAPQPQASSLNTASVHKGWQPAQVDRCRTEALAVS